MLCNGLLPQVLLAALSEFWKLQFESESEHIVFRLLVFQCLCNSSLTSLSTYAMLP